MTISNGTVSEYRVTMMISFVLDDLDQYRYLRSSEGLVTGDSQRLVQKPANDVCERRNRFKCMESAPDEVNKNGFNYDFRFTNDIALNDLHLALRIPFLEYSEFDKKSKQSIFSWVTNSPISADIAHDMARVCRTRWNIQNELLKVFKNKSYNMEHSYGHCEQLLCSPLEALMLLAFLIDEIAERSCRPFQATRAADHVRIALWEWLQALFFTFDIQDWKSLMRTLANQGSL